jgi:hypothetical protein
MFLFSFDSAPETEEESRSISPRKRFTDQELERITKLSHAFLTQDFLNGPHFKIIPKVHQAPWKRVWVFEKKAIGIIPCFSSLLFGQAMRWQVG